MKLTISLLVMVLLMSLLNRYGSTEEIKNTLLEFVNSQLDKLHFPMKQIHTTLGHASRSITRMTFIRHALYPDKCWKRGLGTIAPFRLNLTTGMRKAWCDTQSFGGGAIVIQKKSTSIESFKRNWTDYARGFGNVYGDFWFGNDALHELTQNNKWKLKIESWKQTRYYHSIYDLFRVGPPDDDYRVTVGKLQNGTQALRSRRYLADYDINNMKFTTYDRDNDNRWGKNCAADLYGGFWYNSCAEFHPNAHMDHMIWYEITGWDDTMDEMEMKMKEFY